MKRLPIAAAFLLLACVSIVAHAQLRGHGGPVKDPQRFVRALAHHRRQRETSILNRLAAGDRKVQEIVPAIYQGLAPALRGAAGLSVFAHLEDLVTRGMVASDGPPTLQGVYRLAYPRSAGAGGEGKP